MGTQLALLRGINVGGHNRIRMADLRDLHSGLGHGEVTTYIQSGNVIFSAEDSGAGLEKNIEDAIRDHFGLDIAVVVRSPAELASALDTNPYGRQAENDPLKVATAFLKAAPERAARDAVDPDTHAPDVFSIAGREIHLHCPNGFGRSKLDNAWLERRLGVVSTIRNAKTVKTLAELVNERSG